MFESSEDVDEKRDTSVLFFKNYQEKVKIEWKVVTLSLSILIGYTKVLIT